MSVNSPMTLATQPSRFLLVSFLFVSAPALAQDAGVDPDAGVPADAGVESDAALPEPEPEPPRQFTGIRGNVTDAATGESLIEATVQVVRGGPQHQRGSTLTDLDGNYALELPAGTYELRVSYDLYRARRVKGVIVRRGATTLDVKLAAEPGAVEEFVVEAKMDKRTESAGLTKRRKAAGVQDAVSAQEISRSGDSNAGEAVKRVVSATVVGGRYVFVRGLGGRYSVTLLNGVVLPSPDPDSSAVPLDIFPASLLANLTVAKSYTPDLPGTFAGGALLIDTNSYPAEFELKLKLSGAFDSESTFRDQLTYRGGSYDWLGVDSGRRDLPAAVPRDRPAVQSVENGIDRAQIEAIGQSFKNSWNLHDTTALPSFGIGGTMGDTLAVAGHKIGYLGSLNYGHKNTVQIGEVARVSVSDAGGIQEKERLTSTVGIEAVSLGGLANVGLDLGRRGSVNLFTLYTRSADDRATSVQGYSESEAGDIEARRMAFVTRALSFTQLSGELRFPGATDLSVLWQGNVSYTTRDEPDTRDIQFDLLEDGRRRFQNDSGSGERFFSTLDDLGGGGGIGATLSLAAIELRAGGLAHATSRQFEARRFRFNFIGRDPAVLFLDPEEMLNDLHIGPDFRLEEKTLQADTYDASSRLYSAYAMVDIKKLAPLRLVGGLRVERQLQLLTPGSPFSIVETPEDGVDREETNFLPALNAVYAISAKMNVRAGYSFTLARAHLRELAPFLYFDFARRRATSGNPELLTTRIHNADLRWEVFPGEREVIAASLFYKQFRDPIESVIVNVAQGDISYANAFGATAAGVELEARSSFGRIDPRLKDFRIAGNLTLIRSEIDLGDEAGPQTNATRPLQGQSPYVVNVDLGWGSKKHGTEISLLYNVYGPRIAEVGIEGLPDVYEQPFHRVDVSASYDLGQGFKLKGSATNLLNQPVLVQQGDVVVQRYSPGIAANLALEWSPL